MSPPPPQSTYEHHHHHTNTNTQYCPPFLPPTLFNICKIYFSFLKNCSSFIFNKQKNTTRDLHFTSVQNKRHHHDEPLFMLLKERRVLHTTDHHHHLQPKKHIETNTPSPPPNSRTRYINPLANLKCVLPNFFFLNF